MKLNRATLRRMILKEIKMLSEGLQTLEFKLIYPQSRRGTKPVKIKKGTYDVKIDFPQSTPGRIKFTKCVKKKDEYGKEYWENVGFKGGKIDGEETPSGVTSARQELEVYFPEQAFYRIKGLR